MRNETVAPSVTENIDSSTTTASELAEEQLHATGNPALARLANAMQGKGSGCPKNYGRMHHRHNRS